MRLVEGVMNGANRGLVGSSGLLWLLVRKLLLFGPLNRRPKNRTQKLLVRSQLPLKEACSSAAFLFVVLLRLMHALSTTAPALSRGRTIALSLTSRRTAPPDVNKRTTALVVITFSTRPTK